LQREQRILGVHARDPALGDLELGLGHGGAGDVHPGVEGLARVDALATLVDGHDGQHAVVWGIVGQLGLGEELVNPSRVD
jgi:hypothetical protein